MTFDARVLYSRVRVDVGGKYGGRRGPTSSFPRRRRGVYVAPACVGTEMRENAYRRVDGLVISRYDPSQRSDRRDFLFPFVFVFSDLDVSAGAYGSTRECTAAFRASSLFVAVVGLLYQTFASRRRQFRTFRRRAIVIVAVPSVKRQVRPTEKQTTPFNVKSSFRDFFELYFFRREPKTYEIK